MLKWLAGNEYAKTILSQSTRVASRMMFTIASRAPQVQLAGALGVFMNAHGEILTWSFAESKIAVKLLV